MGDENRQLAISILIFLFSLSTTIFRDLTSPEFLFLPAIIRSKKTHLYYWFMIYFIKIKFVYVFVHRMKAIIYIHIYLYMPSMMEYTKQKKREKKNIFFHDLFIYYFKITFVIGVNQVVKRKGKKIREKICCFLPVDVFYFSFRPYARSSCKCSLKKIILTTTNHYMSEYDIILRKKKSFYLNLKVRISYLSLSSLRKRINTYTSIESISWSS